jgi:outer membrane biosynthesis protein TonB
MRWWVLALVACSKTPEQVSSVNSEKAAAAPEKSAPEPEKPAVSAEPTPSVEPVASAAPSVTATKKGPKEMTSAEKAALAKELDALDMKALGSLGGPGPQGTNALDTAGTAKPIATTTASTTVVAPTGEAATGAAVGAPPGADSVIARNRWRQKVCYNKQLNVDPTAAGMVKVSVTINADGAVTSSKQVSTTAPAMLSACVTSSFMSMKFEAGTAATFTVPITFTKK